MEDSDVRSVQLKRSESHGFGFSVFGGSALGLPPVIYEVADNSPAAFSGQLEAGDVILEVNDTKVVSLTTKEVLKCLRLSNDVVTLKIRKDPAIRDRVQRHMAASSEMEVLRRPAQDTNRQNASSADLYTSKHASASPPAQQCPPEANGEKHNGEAFHHHRSPPVQQRHNQQSPSSLHTSDSESDSPQSANTNSSSSQRKSSTSSSSSQQRKCELFTMTGDLIINLNAKTSNDVPPPAPTELPPPPPLPPGKPKKFNFGQCSTPASPDENDYHRARSKGTKREASSLQSPVAEKKGSFSYNASFVRTSKSEDHLQKASVTTVNIDIDDDMASSLNTLLDTKQDNERIVWTYNAPVTSSSTPSPYQDDKSPLVVSPQTPTSSSPRTPSSDESSRTASPPLVNISSGKFIGSPGRRRSGDVRSRPSDSDNSAPTSTGSGKPNQDNCSELDCCTSELVSAFGSEEADRVHASEFELSSPTENLSPGDDFSKDEDWMAEPDLSESHFRHPMIDGAPPPLRNTGGGGGHQHPHHHRGDAVEERAYVHLEPGGTKRMPHSRSSCSSMSRTDASETLELDSPQSAYSEGTLEDTVPYQELKDNQDEEALLGNPNHQGEHEPRHYTGPGAEEEGPGPQPSASPPTDDESDIESLHSFHYSPKAVDMPSASRLAKRLYNLEGFKKSDVSRHLSKNNEFSRVVAEEYLRFFDFTNETLDLALRKFLKQFCLIGETQERERVLVHFSKRYLDTNPGSFKSQDAVHTLTCAIMLLNTDLHGENIGRKMTCIEFIENLAELNEGENFPKEVLKALYQAIKVTPLEWAVDEENEGVQQETHFPTHESRPSGIGHNPFLEVPNPNCATEYKKGYVMRKCCSDPSGKRTPLGKRGWKMFCATLRDLVLYLHKDEQGFRKNQLYDSLHNSIRIHHALATKAGDYHKKQHVFRLQTADQAEYLFQTGDAKELQSWIDTINFVAASLSAPPLASAVGSQKKFQRPLLPVSHTKFNLREQLQDHENRIVWLEKEYEEHMSHVPERGAKTRHLTEHSEKEAYLQYELKRYRTYAYLLRSKMAQYPELEPPLVETCIGEVDEPVEKSDGSGGKVQQQQQHQQQQSSGEGRQQSSSEGRPKASAATSGGKRSVTDRFSYRAAIYKNGSNDCG